MTIAAIREKLHNYINIADDEKVKAIYTLVENEISTEYKWHEDENFVAELEDRYARFEAGTDKGYSIDKVRSFMQERKREIKKDSNTK